MLSIVCNHWNQCSGSGSVCFWKITLGSLQHRYRRQAENFSTGTTGVVDTGGKFATCVNDSGSKFCSRCQRHRWRIIGTEISDFWHLKVKLKEKIYLYFNSTTQRCPHKIIKTFLIEVFFYLPLVSTKLMVHLEPWISSQIVDTNVIFRDLGKTDSWKKPKVENLVALSL